MLRIGNDNLPVCSPNLLLLSGRLYKWNKVSQRISFDLSKFGRYLYLQINYACTMGLLNPQIHQIQDCPDERYSIHHLFQDVPHFQ